jgi:hypothetical protein
MENPPIDLIEKKPELNDEITNEQLDQMAEKDKHGKSIKMSKHERELLKARLKRMSQQGVKLNEMLKSNVRNKSCNCGK